MRGILASEQSEIGPIPAGCGFAGRPGQNPAPPPPPPVFDRGGASFSPAGNKNESQDPGAGKKTHAGEMAGAESRAAGNKN